MRDKRCDHYIGIVSYIRSDTINDATKVSIGATENFGCCHVGLE